MKNTNILNKKGFTLIELLAVIVILAILMLLATPSVLKIMNNAKSNAADTEVLTLLKAAQTQYASDAASAGSTDVTYSSDTSSSDTSKKLYIDGGGDLQYTIKVSADDNNGVKYSWDISKGNVRYKKENTSFPTDSNQLGKQQSSEKSTE